MVLFDADYPYPKVYSDFCYQKSIQAILSRVLLEVDNWMAYKYYSIFIVPFPEKSLAFYLASSLPPPNSFQEKHMVKYIQPNDFKAVSLIS